jgi:hypothetical protein
MYKHLAISRHARHVLISFKLCLLLRDSLDDLDEQMKAICTEAPTAADSGFHEPSIICTMPVGWPWQLPDASARQSGWAAWAHLYINGGIQPSAATQRRPARPKDQDGASDRV